MVGPLELHVVVGWGPHFFVDVYESLLPAPTGSLHPLPSHSLHLKSPRYRLYLVWDPSQTAIPSSGTAKAHLIQAHRADLSDELCCLASKPSQE